MTGCLGILIAFAVLAVGRITVINTSGALLSGNIATFPVILISVWLAGRFLDRRRFVDFGFHFDKAWWRDFAFGLALGAVLMAGIFGIERVLGWVEVAGSFRRQGFGGRFVPALLVDLLAFVSVGIYEELMWRGYDLRNLAEGLGFLPGGPNVAVLAAWGLSSLAFGISHAINPNASLISTFNIGLAGLFLGLGYVLTGELAIPIGLHITWNFFQGTVFGFPVSGMATTASFLAIQQGGPDLWTGGAFGPEAGLMGIAAMLVGSGLTLLWVRWRRGRVALDQALAVYLCETSSIPYTEMH
ncbi:MAG: CPBP family intramembrane metalloprotease [Anaerolineae bacterium]|nr:CPBP family intramembrane metalloprotease [Anaerolineae bacterium]